MLGDSLEHHDLTECLRCACAPPAARAEWHERHGPDTGKHAPEARAGLGEWGCTGVGVFLCSHRHMLSQLPTTPLS